MRSLAKILRNSQFNVSVYVILCACDFYVQTRALRFCFVLSLIVRFIHGQYHFSKFHFTNKQVRLAYCHLLSYKCLYAHSVY